MGVAITEFKVACKDGTFDIGNGVVAPCVNKGGQKDNSQVPTKSGDSIFKKLAGAYNKNLIVAVVLIAGYFAYKKFKK
jgi:hypothetical protein